LKEVAVLAVAHALQVLAQYSNVARTPFSVPSGAPWHATTNMIFVDVRYILP
jgi:hypothetical protein